ncbi:hypothetical protein [Corynebacterium jeikeium]|uniref:hypothetical protein n=1 Tax=Corynebacterium jeikeium TaxID=38289 RepID=UPI000DA294E9|nr:hypothetical protein [Corynebacterium jeikeium]SQI18680.1 Uncharacterised protein [Corynebacterium jeikeium]
MPELEGRYVWDDDDLRPGRKKEGGLHSTLFDSEGKPKSSATFHPSEKSEPQSKTTREVVYARKGSRGDESFREDMKDIAVQVIVNLVVQGLEKVTPHVQAWVGKQAEAGWRGVEKLRDRRRLGRPRATKVRAEPGETITAELVDIREDRIRPKMSSAEAKERIAVADAFSAFAEEQRRIVAESKIVDDSDLDQDQMQLAYHPQKELEQSKADLANPAASLERQNLELSPAPKDESEGGKGSKRS